MLKVANLKNSTDWLLMVGRADLDYKTDQYDSISLEYQIYSL